jgi:hypothetical protein
VFRAINNFKHGQAPAGHAAVPAPSSPQKRMHVEMHLPRAERHASHLGGEQNHTLHTERVAFCHILAAQEHRDHQAPLSRADVRSSKAAAAGSVQGRQVNKRMQQQQQQHSFNRHQASIAHKQQQGSHIVNLSSSFPYCLLQAVEMFILHPAKGHH